MEFSHALHTFQKNGDYLFSYSLTTASFELRQDFIFATSTLFFQHVILRQYKIISLQKNNQRGLTHVHHRRQIRQGIRLFERQI